MQRKASLLLTFLFLLAAGCSTAPSASDTAKAPGTTATPSGKPIDELVIAFRGDAASLDPHVRIETTTMTFNAHLYNFLVAYDADGQIQPQLAESWRTVAPDLWEFKLRSGVKFHNGEPFNAKQAAYSIMRVKTNPKSELKANVAAVKEMTAVDDLTLQVRTNGPAPMLLLGLSQIAMVPEAYIAQVGDEALGSKPVGTGPYKLVEWKRNEYLALQANPEYWGPKPAFSKVKLRPIPDPVTRVAALIAGEVQVAESVSAEDLQRITGNPKLTVLRTPSQRAIYLGMDYWRNEGSPGSLLPGQKNPFMDLRVRKALYSAINEDEIIQGVMGGAATPAAQVMHPKVFGYNPDLKRLPYDPAAAKQLLAQAGYPNGFKVRLDATNDRFVNDQQIAEAVAGQLKKVGIDVEVNAYPKSKMYPDMDAGKFTLMLMGWGHPNVSTSMNSLFHCRSADGQKGTANRYHYCNSEVDKLIDKADVTMDDGQRLKLYQEAMRMIQEQDVVWVPLHYEEILLGVDKRVTFKPRFDELILAYEMRPQ